MFVEMDGQHLRNGEQTVKTQTIHILLNNGIALMRKQEDDYVYLRQSVMPDAAKTIKIA